MPSWRDTASDQAQADVEQLLDTGLKFAQNQLGKRGEFFPCAVGMQADGQNRMIAVDIGKIRPASPDLIEACVSALTAQRSELRAAAVVSDVRVPSLDSDAIRVSVEHVEGLVLVVLLPYAKRRSGGIDYSTLSTSLGTRRIWATAS